MPASLKVSRKRVARVRTRDSRAPTRWGVNARTTSLRSFVWSGGSMPIIEGALCVPTSSSATPFVDVPIRTKGMKPPPQSQQLQQQSSSKQRPPKEKPRPLRKSPLYHNAKLEAPDGQPLCVCDVKKAQWYLDKGFGAKISDDPFVVRLNFEPSGRPEGEAGEYYLTFKENVCVVCGKHESYLRKYIVPHEYRKHFPGGEFFKTKFVSFLQSSFSPQR